MKKGVIIAIVVGLILAGIGGYFVYKTYNKPHRSVADEEAAFTFTDAELAALFSRSATAGEEKLKNKVIAVSGTVKKTETANGFTSVSLDPGGAYIISIQMDQEEKGTVNKDAAISIKALYVGVIEGDEDFGIPGEIKLKNGFIQ